MNERKRRVPAMKTNILLVNALIPEYRTALQTVGPRLRYWYSEQELCAMTRNADAQGAVAGDTGYTRVTVANSYSKGHPGDCLRTHLEKRPAGWYITEVERVAKTSTQYGRGSSFVSPGHRQINN